MFTISANFLWHLFLYEVTVFGDVHNIWICSETIMSFFSILLENCFRQKSENYNVGSSAAFQSYSMIADYEAHLYLQIVIVRSVISPLAASERREGSQKIRKSGWIFQFVLLDVLRLLTCIVIQTVPYDTLKDTTRPFSPTFSDLFFRENSQRSLYNILELFPAKM